MTNNIFDQMREDDKLKSAYKAPPKRDRFDYYSDPRDNPIRYPLCVFLMSQGLPDYYEMTVLYSNYQLEVLARHKGYGKRDDDGNATLKAIEECERMAELARQNPAMLDAPMWEEKLNQLRRST